MKTSRLLLLALALGGANLQLAAAPIEHIGDRYMIHVPELELTGEESLLDVLMMCPEVMTLDGNNIIGGDPFANLYGKFVIRIDNQEYGLDYATLLHHFKAREIETIKVCQNAEVMKGCSSLKKVIDITLRKGENGVSGRVGFFGDTYGGGKGIVSVLSQQQKLRILSHVEGSMQRSSAYSPEAYPGDNGSTSINHYSHEGAKLNILWTPTRRMYWRWMRCRPIPAIISRAMQPISCVPTISRRITPEPWAKTGRASSLLWVPRISATRGEAVHRISNYHLMLESD